MRVCGPLARGWLCRDFYIVTTAWVVFFCAMRVVNLKAPKITIYLDLGLKKKAAEMAKSRGLSFSQLINDLIRHANKSPLSEEMVRAIVRDEFKQLIGRDEPKQSKDRGTSAGKWEANLPLNLKELSEIQGVSYKTVVRWASDPAFPRIQRLVRREDFLKWWKNKATHPSKA
jgi:hypothetical protein